MTNPQSPSTLHASFDPARAEDAVLVALSEYAMDGTMERLTGEKDDNFLLTTHKGERFLMKVAHPNEDAEVMALQSAVLLFLEDHATKFRVQRVVRNLDGRADFVVGEGPLSGRSVRITSYLDGTLMRMSSSSARLRRHVGETCAALNAALVGFDHPAAHRRLLWDLQHVHDLRPLIEELDDPHDRHLLLGELEHFERLVGPQLTSFRSQVIHNDLSTDNLLVTDDANEVAGVIDFGDVVHAPLVNDLAVAVSYQLSSTTDVVAAACDVVRGFHSVTPLSESELALLPALVTARTLTWVTIPAWRAVRVPNNREYVLRNAERSRTLLHTLLEVPDEHFVAELFRACRKEET